MLLVKYLIFLKINNIFSIFSQPVNHVNHFHDCVTPLAEYAGTFV